MAREFSRRTLITTAASALVAVSSAGANAWSLGLVSADGSPIRSQPMASSDVTADLSGLQRYGSSSADTSILELFDYNCGYCRTASQPLRKLIESSRSIALTLFHSPIFGQNSRDVAVLQQTVAGLFGAARAYEYHHALLAERGPLDRARALQVAASLQLDVASAPSASRADAEAQVAAQAGRALSLKLKITPTFIIADTAFIGWPGETTLNRFIDAKRQCGQLACG